MSHTYRSIDATKQAGKPTRKGVVPNEHTRQPRPGRGRHARFFNVATNQFERPEGNPPGVPDHTETT